MGIEISKGFTLWFTGLPCSGKTTISDMLEKRFRAAGQKIEHLDGDVMRKSLSKDLGFSKEDRDTNIERVTFVASLLSRNGVGTLVSFVSPYRRMRDNARAHIENFAEIYVDCPLTICEERDVKGMYRLAREGKIAQFTGVSDPYEPPTHPEVTVATDRMSPEECLEKILAFLEIKGWLMPRNPYPKSAYLSQVFSFAAEHHRGQTRKGGLPYITHPIAVAKMLSEAGYPETVVAAALLHDVLEDSGCEVEEMERAAGEAATRIVLEITDKDKTARWKQRKENYFQNLGHASADALAVACADKTHNLRCLLEGYQAGGSKFSKLFSGGFSEKIENYRNILNLIAQKSPALPLLAEYRQALSLLEKAAAAAAR